MSAVETNTLTMLELEVLSDAACGLTNVEIGKRRFVSAKTIEHELARVRTKLGAKNTAHAVYLACYRELI